MSEVIASPSGTFIVEYRRPPRLRKLEQIMVETTSTAVSTEVVPLRATPADDRELQDILVWASSREDLPEYPDSPEEIAERSEFLVAIAPALLESIERRSA